MGLCGGEAGYDAAQNYAFVAAKVQVSGQVINVGRWAAWGAFGVAATHDVPQWQTGSKTQAAVCDGRQSGMRSNYMGLHGIDRIIAISQAVPFGLVGLDPPGLVGSARSNHEGPGLFD